MDSAECEISPGACAKALIEANPKLPTAKVTPVINWRRVGLFAGKYRFFLSIILNLRVVRNFMHFGPCGHGSTGPKYVQDHILVERKMPFEGYFGEARLEHRCLIQQDTATRLGRRLCKARGGSSTGMDLMGCPSKTLWPVRDGRTAGSTATLRVRAICMWRFWGAFLRTRNGKVVGKGSRWT